MDITILQILGAMLVVNGGYGVIKGDLPWSFELGPGSPRADIDLTPKALKYRREGVLSGAWLRPVCAVTIAIGLLLILVFTGETVVISI